MLVGKLLGTWCQKHVGASQPAVPSFFFEGGGVQELFEVAAEET